jgi:ribosomal protein S17
MNLSGQGIHLEARIVGGIVINVNPLKTVVIAVHRRVELTAKGECQTTVWFW